jgi:SAM-dependent methyltransferase
MTAGSRRTGRGGGPRPATPPRPAHPLFAAAYDLLAGPFDRRLILPLRRRLLAGCSGDLLDVGAGTGGNFPVLREMVDAGADLRLQATEPDPHMLRRARRRAESLRLDVRLHGAPAEALPFHDASFDHVVATLVLCTVADPERSLAEMHRVLRPGGELRFMEHVRAGGAAGSWQDRLRPLWASVGGGCQLNRRTGETIRRSAFAEAEWETVSVPFPLCRLLLGRARKR